MAASEDESDVDVSTMEIHHSYMEFSVQEMQQIHFFSLGESQDEEGNIQPGPSRNNCWHLNTSGHLLVDNFTLSEAAKLEMSGVYTKTPVTVLQEILSKQGSVPKYDLVQIEGAIHEPTFRYRVAFGEMSATGTGRSKKEAKHAAAKNILLRLSGNALEGYGPDSNFDEKPQAFSLTLDDKVFGNPIGTLQEMCMVKRWPPPNYRIIEEEGLPHERLFTIECKLLDFAEIGVGKSKKLAKRQAANKMWERVKVNTSEPPAITAGVPQRPESSAPCAELKKREISTLTTPHFHRISLFHKALKDRIGEKIDELQASGLYGPDFDCIKFLSEIAHEQQFEITYVDVDERSSSGLYQCLIQLSTFPIAVCYGSGTDVEDARAVAARNALDYLKIMTKK